MSNAKNTENAKATMVEAKSHAREVGAIEERMAQCYAAGR